ncbi:MAG: VWA domain-containing protein [Deltaproteobacteria bacterium]|nr:VWA domain-containing protein [Deltaproteobacteria bacterium]
MGAIGLLLPKAMWLAAAALPLVLLYVLKTRRHRVRVASAALFDLARREATARDPWKRLVPELALLLQLLALILLALAFARPVSKGTGYDADSVVIVLDRSASLATRVRPIPSDKKGASPTRMTRARDAADKLVDDLGIGAEIAVVIAGRDAHVASALARGGKRAKEAIAAVEPGLVEGDLQPALDVARDLLRGRAGRRRVVLFTDAALARQPTWLDEEGGPGLDVQVVDAPSPGAAREGNVGIVRVDVHRGPTALAADRVEVGVVLAAYGAPQDGRTRFVTLRRIDRSTALDAQKVDVGQGGRASVTLGFSPAGDGSDELATLAVELSPVDALALDDFAQVVVPPPRKMPVLLASLGVGGATWIGKALAADPEVKLSKSTPDKMFTVGLEPWSFVVVADSCPQSAPGGGDVLVVNPPPGTCAGRAVGAAVTGAALPPITSWSPSDPRLRYVELEGVKLGRVVPIGPVGGDATQGAALLGPAALVRAESLAVMADASTLDRTVTIWGFDPADGDLARKAAFVLLVRDAVDVARARRDRSWAPSTRAGIAARVVAASGAKEIVATRLPGGEIAARAPVLEGVALLEGLDRPGPYALSGAATGAPLTVSLLSEHESDVERVVEPVRQKVSALGSVPAAKQAEVAAIRARADLRWIVAAVAALFLALDALWLTRRGARVVAKLGRRPA